VCVFLRRDHARKWSLHDQAFQPRICSGVTLFVSRMKRGVVTCLLRGNRFEGGASLSTNEREHRIIARLRGVSVIIRQELAKARVRSRDALLGAGLAVAGQDDSSVGERSETASSAAALGEARSEAKMPLGEGGERQSLAGETVLEDVR
jgi:hypothetical protein